MNEKINARKIKNELIKINKTIYDAFSNKLDSNKLLRNDFINIFDYSLYVFDDEDEGLIRIELTLFEEFSKIFNKHALDFNRLIVSCRISSLFKNSARRKNSLTIYHEEIDLFERNYDIDSIFSEVIEAIKEFNYYERFLNEENIEISTFLTFEIYDPHYYDPINEIHSVEIISEDSYKLIDIF